MTTSRAIRRGLAALSVLLILVLAGCSGKTTPPGDVTKTSADLRAKVSCGEGENCSMYFKYGLADGALDKKTPTTDPQVAGPFTDVDVHWPVDGLEAGRIYAYQVCGNAQPGQTFFCAGPDGLNNTRQEFRTQPECTTTLNPGASIATAVQNAAAGAVICLNPGTTGQTYTAPSILSSNGTSSAPVTLTSADPVRPATLVGRLQTKAGVKYLTISQLRINWSSTDLGAPTVVLAGNNVTLSHNDISGANQVICVSTGSTDGSVTSTNSTIDRNKIHDCGDTNDAGDRIHAQGVYTNPGTSFLRVSNNWCYRVAARCYQERFGQNDTWTRNVADYENWGFIFGDQGPNNDSMTLNISGPHHYQYGSTSYTLGGDLVEDMDEGGVNNSFTNNCWQGKVYYNHQPPPAGLTVSSNTVGTPTFKDPANGDFRLKLDSECANFGPTGSLPGPTGSTP